MLFNFNRHGQLRVKRLGVGELNATEGEENSFEGAE